MTLCAIGVSHRTAPVALRERLSFGLDELADALRDLASYGDVSEAVIVSTCNRTDIYCGLSAPDPAPVLEWLGRRRDLDRRLFDAHGYVHQSSRAVRHAMRVASGLDSLVLGETQILGQVKRAYRAAARTGTLGLRLGRLFPAAFSAAKDVRTGTAIGAGSMSVASAAVAVARTVFDDFQPLTGVVVGAGETGALLARHLRALGIGDLTIANRTVSRAAGLAAELHGRGIGLDELPAALARAHVVLCAADCESPLVGVRDMRPATGRGLPVFVADLGVPRNVEPAVDELGDVYLYSVDDLEAVVAQGHLNRRAAVSHAEGILDGHVARYERWLGEREVTPVIRAMRRSAESRRDEALAAARRRLAAGDPAHDVLARLAHRLTSTLMHAPTIGLRAAGARGDVEVVEAGRVLLGLQDASEATNGCR